MTPHSTRLRWRSVLRLSSLAQDQGERVLERIVIASLRFYRRFLSALKPRPTCRYLPTCSEYAIEAIEKRGVLVGGLKAAWRICRCNPLFHGGYHPVDRQK